MGISNQRVQQLSSGLRFFKLCIGLIEGRWLGKQRIWRVTCEDKGVGLPWLEKFVSSDLSISSREIPPEMGRGEEVEQVKWLVNHMNADL